MPAAVSATRTCHVHRVPMRDPADTSGLEQLIDNGELDAGEIVAILGKTEGNGCVNDFTRAYAVSSLQSMLAQRLKTTSREIAEHVAIVMSGGTEGGLSPHLVAFSVKQSASPPSFPRALAIGSAFTPSFAPEELGRLSQVDATAEAVGQAMTAAGIADNADVHYVQVKCPLLTNEQMADAHARGKIVVTEDTYASMGFSRAASALGVAVALGEVARSRLTDDMIGRDFSVWSGRASTSAGIELSRNEIVVLGNSEKWSGDLMIGHAVMRDPIDFSAVLEALAGVGFRPQGQLSESERSRIAAVLAKAEPPRAGTIRGQRHIMWNDSDIHATRHARAVVGGVIAAAVGRTDIFVSGGAEHQGPDGGGPIAIIGRQAQ